MSRPVDERLRELEEDVQHLLVLPAAAVRARGRRRARRQLTAVVAAGAVLAAAASAAFAWPHQRNAPVNPAEHPVVSCVLALPDDPAEVRIRVLDGGAPAGLLDTVATQLRARKFAVQNGPAGRSPVGGAAALRYGPTAIGAATVLRAEVHGPVTMTFDPDRRDDTIDLSVGPAFTRFATATEVNQGLALAGEPSAPPQCSTVAPRTPVR
jgi:LytR cell envelope-related transcriptional attenuator